MCGRFTSTTSPGRLAEAFGVEQVRAEELPVRFNVAPTQLVYAVAESPPGPDRRRLLGAFRWGLVPPWARDPGVGARMINARAEGLATKTAFRSALAARRCIIPADAFYEWQLPADGGRGPRQPYAFARVDGQPMAFAGLWERWRDRDQPDQPPMRSCAIVTTAANEVVAPVHHRMPVILPAEAWSAWLDPAGHEVATVMDLLVPARPGLLRAWAVGTRVNSAANEGPGLLDEVAGPARPGHPPAAASAKDRSAGARGATARSATARSASDRSSSDRSSSDRSSSDRSSSDRSSRRRSARTRSELDCLPGLEEAAVAEGGQLG